MGHSPYDEVLAGELRNHWTAAAAGLALFERVARTHSDAEVAVAVHELAHEIAVDRDELHQMMRATGVAPSRLGALAGQAAERIGRLKPNGRLLSRSPVTDILELEALRTAVAGKRTGWQFLQVVAEHDERLERQRLDGLVERADAQLQRLEALHLQTVRARLVP